MRLGIDYGTTRTVIAAVREGRYPVASFRTDSGFVEYLPGLASVTQNGLRYGTDAESEWSIGQTKRDAAELQPLVRSVKEAVTGAAPDETVSEMESAGISALGLVTDYLRYVRTMLVERSNLDIAPDEPLEAMVAVPAHASTRQRYLTLEAFSQAGFSVLGLVNEPTAGAIEYARHTLAALSARSPKRYIVVYDLGGGTFDTAAVPLVDRRFDLIGADAEADIFVREAPTRHFGVRRESEAGWEKVFDPIIEKRTGVRVDGPPRVERSYYPAHPVGLLRFVKCTNLDARRQPTGEVTPWDSVLFPYDPGLTDCQDLSPQPAQRAEGELGQEIVEPYEYSPTGMIRVKIENRTSGYEREYVLGRGAV